MRLEAQAKAGFYPTPPAVVDIIKTWIGEKSRVRADFSILAAALASRRPEYARSAGCDAYGVEINTERAQSAKNLLNKVVARRSFQRKGTTRPAFQFCI